MKRILPILILLLLMQEKSTAQSWTFVGNGLDWNVYDLTTFNDTLYAAGRLGAPSRGVFLWNGDEWENTAYFWGIFSPLTLSEYNNELYTSGDFTGNNGDPTRVFKWNGITWEQQGANFTGGEWNSVKKLFTYDDFLYAGGQFESIDGQACKNIARWDGLEWEPVFDGIPGLISEMDVFNGSLVVNHSTTDTIPTSDSTFTINYRQKLQILSTNDWLDLDSIFEFKRINLVGVIEDEIYFSSKDTINGIPINGLGKWDGVNFTSLGNDLFRSVFDIEQFNNELHISCELETGVDWIYEDQVLKRVGNLWVSVGEIFDNSILKLHVHGDELYSAGFFEEYNSSEMLYVSKFVPNPDGINEQTRIEIEVFPNPVKESLRILSQESLIDRIELYNINGALIRGWDVNYQLQFDLPIINISTGIYQIILRTENGMVSKKIIKN